MFYIDDKENIAHGEFFVKSPETDCFYKARPGYYFGLNQEMGGLHATGKGVGLKKLYDEEAKTWMIVRTRMQINKLAAWGDTINLETWCHPGYKLYCPRIVKAVDKDSNESLFTAENWWVIMDLARKRPCKPSILEDRLPSADLTKHPFNPEFPAFPKVEEYENIATSNWNVTVTYYDTDYNRHVNNISYVNWIIEALPKEFLDNYQPTFMDVKWEKQSYLTDKLTVETYTKNSLTDEKPLLFSRIIKKTEGGDEIVFEAASEWVKREN